MPKEEGKEGVLPMKFLLSQDSLESGFAASEVIFEADGTFCVSVSLAMALEGRCIVLALASVIQLKRGCFSHPRREEAAHLAT